MNDLRTPAPQAIAIAQQAPKSLIDGRWFDGKSDQTMSVVNPASGQILCAYNYCDAAQVDSAVGAALRSFADRRWRDLSGEQRQNTLEAIADLIDRDADILADLETLNGGKPTGSARHGEIPAAAACFRYYAKLATSLPEESFEPSIPGLQLSGRIRYQAIGPVAAMVPWNGPLVIAAWKLAPALAAGCSVVLKPSELTPLSTVYLGQLLQEAGIPDGVVNIVHGARDVGAQLVQHEDIRKLSFTGSTATGKKLISAASGNMKRLTLELGGKSPVVVLDDADIDAAIDGAADAIFGNAGQVCVAGSRVYVHESHYSRFTKGLCERAEALKTGSPWSSETTLGPLISKGHRHSVHSKVERAVSDGATLLTGGYIPDGTGFFYPGTVLSDTQAEMDIVCEEVFGPVVTVTSFSTDNEAIAMANDSNYGLAASVWSRDLAKAEAIGERLESGIVWLNCHGIPDPSMPIGGMKSSGWGRELGVEGLKSYLEMQSFMTRS